MPQSKTADTLPLADQSPASTTSRDITDEDLCATCAHLQCGEKKGYPNASPDLWHAPSKCALDFPFSRVEMNVITSCPAYLPSPPATPALTHSQKVL